MKLAKGQPGYLNQEKKIEIIKVCISFGLIAAIVGVGYIQTGTKLNWLTLIAVLGCLPAAKQLVGVITRLPHKSIDGTIAEEIRGKSTHLTVAFDLVVTSYEKIMPIDCVVVSKHTVCGYTRRPKMDLTYTAKHIKQMLGQNHIEKVSVKIFTDYHTFLSRVEGMENIGNIDRSEEEEHKIVETILNISL